MAASHFRFLRSYTGIYRTHTLFWGALALVLKARR